MSLLLDAVHWEFVHITLPLLPADVQLVLDMQEGIVSLLYAPENQSARHARILTHQLFSTHAMKALAVLFKHPDYCSLPMLLAALDLPLEHMHAFMTVSSLSQEHIAFQNCVKAYTHTLAIIKAKERERFLGHLREVIRELRSLQTFQLSLQNIPSHGYYLTYSNSMAPVTRSRKKWSVRVRNPQKSSRALSGGSR
jgi:hypothetical protein